MIVYVDSSALGSIYLGDEADAAWLREIVFDGPNPVVTSELADVEITSSLARAERDGRITHPDLLTVMQAFEDHTADDGPLGIVPLSEPTLALAKTYLLSASVRGLDAIHIAAAQIVGQSSQDDVVILTRDKRQGRAAKQLGFALHPRSAS